MDGLTGTERAIGVQPFTATPSHRNGGQIRRPECRDCTPFGVVITLAPKRTSSMATGSSTQLTRQIGEHLVAAKLGRLGLFATPFAGNVPDFDLVVANASGQSSLIQVKAINGPSWQFNASTFLNIEMVGNEQVVKGKKKLPHLKIEWVMGNPRSWVKGGRSPAERTLDARSREIRWPVAGCGALSHPAMEAMAGAE